MALRWIGGSNVDHPMADLKKARLIVEELPAKDAVKSLEEIAEWLESLNRTDGFRVDRRYENVDLLDLAARRFQKQITRDYLSTPRVQKYLENRLWNAQFNFCRQLSDAYIRCVKECLAGFGGAGAVQKTLPVIVGRGVRALTLQLKWLLLRYGLVEERIWVEIAQLYRLAEERGIADEAMTPYPAPEDSSTVRREFLKALMLSASSTDGLPPARQDIAERVIAHFAGAVLLSHSAEGATHCFDLAAPKAPTRLFKGLQPGPTLRYFGAGGALARLNQLEQLTAGRGALPQDITLGGAYPHDVVLSVIKHLALYWSIKAPARGSERRPIAERITVVPGADGVFGMLDPTAGDDLDFSGNEAAESWIVENVSEGGCGAIVPPQKTDWVKVGTLIGMKSETSDYVGIGLIRRITRDAHRQRRVGIQVLTKAAIPTTISRANTMSSLNFDLRTRPAVLLTTSPDAQGEIGMLLRGGSFNGSERMTLSLRDKSYLLMPSRLVEAGEDFDWAKFKVTRRSE